MTTYQNVRVTINGNNVYATSASVNFQVPMESVRGLGFSKAVASVPNGGVEGSIDIDYIVANEPVYSIFQSIISSPTTYRGTSINIGGTNYQGYLTSFSMNGEPNTVITASASFTVFGGGGPNFSSLSPQAVSEVSVAHGAGTTLSIAQAIGFNYSVSIDWQPLYFLGQQTVALVVFGGGSESLNLRGNNAGRVITQCPVTQTASVNLSSVCGGGAAGNITISNGKIVSSEGTVQVGNATEAGFTVTKFY